MAKHVKPTTEELEAGAQKALEEAEALEPKVDEPPVPEPEPQPPEPSEPAPPEKPEEPDYRKKFTESTREAQVLHAKNRKLNEAIDKAGDLLPATDDELQREYPEWAVMNDLEKKMARKSFDSERRFAAIQESAKEFKDIEAWNTKVDDFTDNPKTLSDNPDLEGKMDEFKLFSTKASRRGVDFEDLVSAFLYDVSKSAKPKNKGKMFESGTGGPNTPPKSTDKISLSDARQLRNTDYPRWKELTKAGKIETDDL